MTTSVEENIFSGTKQSMTRLCIGMLEVQLICCSLLPQQPQARLLQGDMPLEDCESHWDPTVLSRDLKGAAAAKSCINKPYSQETSQWRHC